MESQAVLHFENISKAENSPKRNPRIMIQQSVLLGLQPHPFNPFSGAAVGVTASPPKKKLINIP